VVDGIVDAVGGEADEREVDDDGPVGAAFLANVVLEHFEHVQDLPEHEQADQDEPVVEVQFAVFAQCPERAGEQEQGDQGDQQVETVEAGEFRLFLFALFLRRYGGSAEQGGEPEDEGEVGDVVDQTVLDDCAAVAGGLAHDQREHQVREAGAVGHDEGAEHGAFESLAFHDMQTPDHQCIRQREDEEQAQRVVYVGQGVGQAR